MLKFNSNQIKKSPKKIGDFFYVTKSLKKLIMKKIILFSLANLLPFIVTTKTFSMQIATTGNSSFILISKKSLQKLQTIKNDHKKLDSAIQSKYRKNHYAKPSDLIKDVGQDKSIDTKYMTLSLVFAPEDAKHLDQRVREISSQYSTIYAWSTTLILMDRTLENIRDNLQKRELIHSAARVALKKDPAFAQKCKLFGLFDECDDIVTYSIKHFTPEEKNHILEGIKLYKHILIKNKLDARS